MGKPAVFIVADVFVPDAHFNASAEGLANINLVRLPTSAVPMPQEIEELGLGEKVAETIVHAFRQRIAPAGERVRFEEAVPTFAGRTYPEAVEQMEQFFLQHCWSDGYPIVPPTPAAVERMLQGTELPRDRVVGRIEPKGGLATVEKVAINAVMAGCRPHYLPVLIAAVEALADAHFDLRGVQCTAGPTAPLVVISGKRLIRELNLNDSFSAIGPGWRANSTIGRALRLILINLGYGWPGKSDMKGFGSPFKNVIVVAENEDGYAGAWQPLRMAEGYGAADATVSVIAALTWQTELVHADVADTRSIQAQLGRQARVKYDREAMNWGFDNLVLLNPTAFDPIRLEDMSRSAFQQLIYEAAVIPGHEFFLGKEPRVEVGAIPIPREIVDRVKADPDALVPLLRSPENLKVVVTGAPGPALMAYVSTWGFGLSGFVTRKVTLPGNWSRLVAEERGWQTPIVRKELS